MKILVCAYYMCVYVPLLLCVLFCLAVGLSSGLRVILSSTFAAAVFSAALLYCQIYRANKCSK